MFSCFAGAVPLFPHPPQAAKSGGFPPWIAFVMPSLPPADGIAAPKWRGADSAIGIARSRRPALAVSPATRIIALALPLLLALPLTLLVEGCSDTARVEKIEQANRVQDERLRNLEEGLAEAVRKQTQPVLDQMKALDQRMDARMAALNEHLEQLLQEQTRVSGALEVDQAEVKRFARRLDETFKAQAQVRLEQENEFDKLRLRMKDVEALLKSPIAGLPAATEPDKAFREAMFLMVSGQLDLAADKFAAFSQTYPNDRRRPEVLYRQGQAYFLMRKYDFALVPLYDLLEKQPGSKLAPDARWMLARSLEETGDLKLAREFYAQLINAKTVHSADATRRMALINRLYPATDAQTRKGRGATPALSPAESGDKPLSDSASPAESSQPAPGKDAPGKSAPGNDTPPKNGTEGAAESQASKP